MNSNDPVDNLVDVWCHSWAGRGLIVTIAALAGSIGFLGCAGGRAIVDSDGQLILSNYGVMTKAEPAVWLIAYGCGVFVPMSFPLIVFFLVVYVLRNAYDSIRDDGL